MSLSDEQLKTKIKITKDYYKSTFGHEPDDKELIEVLDEAIAKRKKAVLADRLTTQRGDRDLLNLRELLTPAKKTSYAKKKEA